ncbi:MAG: hypothetical protein MJE68_29185, partial [Proteobacteria bacterium]|nr:hypothetical protein [Pseudomonadota bacterium]
LKKGRGGVMGGRVCVTSVTDEPLMGSVGGAIEGRATTNDVVVTEASMMAVGGVIEGRATTDNVVVTVPLMEAVGGAMDGRATIEVVVVTVWPGVKGRGTLVGLAAETDSTFICDKSDERVWLSEAVTVVEG